MFVPTWSMALLEFLGYVFYTQSLACEQHNQVIEHVGSLIYESVVGAVCSLDYSLKSLLAHLLCHTVQSVLEQRRGVRAFGHFLMTLVDEVLQFGEEQQRVGIIGLAPAGVSTEMAGRSGRVHSNQESVVVAIHL